MDEKKQYLLDEKKDYLAVTPTTPQERKALHAWVKKGNSVYSNPWLLYSESGNPMDYITAMRIHADMVSPDAHVDNRMQTQS